MASRRARLNDVKTKREQLNGITSKLRLSQNEQGLKVCSSGKGNIIVGDIPLR
jgi:hypothetical protein